MWAKKNGFVHSRKMTITSYILQTLKIWKFFNMTKSWTCINFAIVLYLCLIFWFYFQSRRTWDKKFVKKSIIWIRHFHSISSHKLSSIVSRCIWTVYVFCRHVGATNTYIEFVCIVGAPRVAWRSKLMQKLMQKWENGEEIQRVRGRRRRRRRGE